MLLLGLIIKAVFELEAKVPVQVTTFSIGLETDIALEPTSTALPVLSSSVPLSAIRAGITLSAGRSILIEGPAALSSVACLIQGLTVASVPTKTRASDLRQGLQTCGAVILKIVWLGQQSMCSFSKPFEKGHSVRSTAKDNKVSIPTAHAVKHRPRGPDAYDALIPKPGHPLGAARLRKYPRVTSTDLTQTWDVIVIGAGMGGGLASLRLAEAGLRVLIIEKGTSGHRKEQQSLDNTLVSPLARRIRGFWPKPIAATVNERTSQFFAPVGSGVGGSSVFYAGALERPERHDLEDTPGMPHPTGGWPVSYDAFLPYFTQAEALLHISGTPDPLSPEPAPDLADPPPLSKGEEAMMKDMAARGLSPYRLHLAMRNLPGCMICLGHKCPRPCKMDGRSAGIEPALATGHAHLLSNADVTELQHSGGKITGVAVTNDGVDMVLKAKTYVLAAGALGSARLMLMSKGCANSSDWVGRGLMFHVNEIFAVWPRRSQQFDGASKAISLRDLYALDGQRFGMIQSMGLEASYGNIAHYLVGLYQRSILRRFQRMRSLFTNIPALIAARILGQAKVFVGILEDLPYPENRVILDPNESDILRFEYTISEELQQRRTTFRHQIKRAFRGYRTLLMGRKVELNYGHPCGTLRFGADPATSVLDASCKAHDLDNLYVADASIFPTSMGVNPSLTIAANALRVADIIAEYHTAKDG